MSKKVLLRGIQAEYVEESRTRGTNHIVFRVKPCVLELVWRYVTQSQEKVGVARDGNTIILERTREITQALRGRKLINLEIVETPGSLFRRGRGHITLRPMVK